MTISLDCSESMPPLSDWEKVYDRKDDKVLELAEKKFEELQKCWQLCKIKGKGKKIKGEPTQKGNIFSIITRIALVGIGSVIGLACAPAGAIVAGTGISLIANGVANEINSACQDIPPKKPNEPPLNSHPTSTEYGGDISITMPI